MARKREPFTIAVTGEQAKRLVSLAKRWNVKPDETLRRVLDQAFVGRGALVALEAGFIALEYFTRKKPEEKGEVKPTR